MTRRPAHATLRSTGGGQARFAFAVLRAVPVLLVVWVVISSMQGVQEIQLHPLPAATPAGATP